MKRVLMNYIKMKVVVSAPFGRNKPIILSNCGKKEVGIALKCVGTSKMP
jgi:hypothetical protein